MGLIIFRRNSWYLGVLLAGMVVLQGCLKNEDYYDESKYFYEDINTILDYVEGNGINAEIDSASGIFYDIHKNGDGYRTLNGAKVDVYYKASTLDGVEFANNFSGNPLTITLGDFNTYTATVTDALIIALFKLHEGDSATIYAPSYHGYRNTAYQNVPPNSILVYTIKFVDIKGLAGEYSQIDQYISDKSLTANIEPEYGTRTVIHSPGNTIVPDYNDYVSLHYQGELMDGTIFDSSFDTFPLEFEFGKGKLIAGFEMGIAQLHELDSATIFVPSMYGYGDVASGEIPANSILVFKVKMLSITKYE